jgi:hypothetical protein
MARGADLVAVLTIGPGHGRCGARWSLKLVRLVGSTSTGNRWGGNMRTVVAVATAARVATLTPGMLS